MGEAKWRRENAVPTVYHHTSTLRTNLIWMSGVIEVEGKGGTVIHPKLGEIGCDATMRRPMKEFPPLAWFTKRISVPRCLTEVGFYGKDKVTGARIELQVGAGAANALALNRMALGFRIADIPVIPWPEHRGYQTGEGRDLNDSAREYGDDPDEWYVSEVPVDVAAISEAWGSKTIMRPKLQRMSSYVDDIKRMVEMCRATPGVFIPPAWVKPADVARMANAAGVGVEGLGRAAPRLGR